MQPLNLAIVALTALAREREYCPRTDNCSQYHAVRRQSELRFSMSLGGKQLSNPFSMGDGGGNFETQVEASFVALMMAGGFVPCLPCQMITKIKVQGSFAGFGTDDLIVFTGNEASERKLLGQVKHSCTITKSNAHFGKVIRSAWTDFNDPNVFTKGRDAIALITGPLSVVDVSDVRTVLEWARFAESPREFLEKVELTNFSSDSKRAKVRAMRFHLDAANGAPIADDEFCAFLRHFHLLGYDLDVRAGVMHAVMHSLIGRFSSDDPASILAQIVVEVMYTKQNSGTITRESLPETLRAAFASRDARSMRVIPASVAEVLPPGIVKDWNTSEFAHALVVADLLGSWNEQSAGDNAIIARIIQGPERLWQEKIRQVIQLADSPLNLRNGVWSVRDRSELWRILGAAIFDEHLELIKGCALAVLAERDPQLVLSMEDRFAASYHGKELSHSLQLRRGVAECLALLGSSHEHLVHCSRNRPETTAALTIRELLHDADWTLWGSLNDLLPMLAEASPQEFLRAVELALAETPCPFDILFAHEGRDFGGRNHMTGLLWALEAIAWDDQYLVSVTVVLGALAARDPGGQWANRPLNSLTQIFLPWLPQTAAPIAKRIAAVETLCRESPTSGWSLLLNLLPGRTTYSSATCRPKWRMAVPDGVAKEITQGEYWSQVDRYAEIAVGIAIQDPRKIEQLTAELDHLPARARDEILGHISSDAVAGLPEEERMATWNTLTDVARKHRRFSDAKWALPSAIVAKIESAALRIQPTSIQNRSRRLFSGRDWELYEDNDNWQEQERKLEDSRQVVIREILRSSDVDGVVQLSESVDSPQQVGFSLGIVALDELDVAVLPAMLNDGIEKHKQLAAGFVLGRFRAKGWAWVDAVVAADWTADQIASFLIILPFCADVWGRAENLLGQGAAAYWQNASAHPYGDTGDLYLAIDKLVECGRPWAAIHCLAKQLRDKKPLDKAHAVRALLDAATSSEHHQLYGALEVIKALQEDPGTPEVDMFRVEWAYLRVMDEHLGVTPRSIERRLATDPEFFCELIRILYRPKDDALPKEGPTEEQQAVAGNVWQLLSEWRTPPGTVSGNEFSDRAFGQWIEAVTTLAASSGHLRVALARVGEVLIHAPGDPDGLWIHRTVAEVLNRPEFEPMRRGFGTAIANSRGVHRVDPTGAPERALAGKYRLKADEVENAGYHRLASTLRSVADSYDREAESAISEHESDNDLGE